MAESDSGSEISKKRNDVLKCIKCNKKVKNGVQCNGCECNVHTKCGNISGPLDELKFTCINCGDKSTPTLLAEVRYRDLQRAFFLLQGECETYKKLYNEMQSKLAALAKDHENLKRNFKEKNEGVSFSKEQNPKSKIPNKSVVNNVENNAQMPQPAQNSVINNEASKQGRSTHQLSVQSDTDKLDYVTVVKENLINKQNTNLENKQDGFQEVRYRKRLSTKPLIGQNKITGSLVASPQMGWLHVYRLSKTTTSEEVLKFLQTSKPNVEFSCEKLSARGDYASFKIGYPLTLHDEINCSDFWPTGIAVRRFFLSRQTPSKNP